MGSVGLASTWLKSGSWPSTYRINLCFWVFFFFLLIYRDFSPQVLVAMVSSYRYEREEVDETLAKSEAVTLHDSIEKKKLDHEHVIWILSTRNKFQLKATFNCYRQCYGKAIDQVPVLMKICPV